MDTAKARYPESHRGQRTERVWIGVHPGTWEAQTFPLEEPVGDTGIKALAREGAPALTRCEKQAESGN